MRNTCINCLAALILSFPNLSKSQDTRSLLGTEFWMTFTENVYTPPDGVLHLIVAPTTEDTITVWNPQIGYSENFAVKPGQQNNIALKFNYYWYSQLSFVAQNTGIRIKSKRPVQVQAINRLDASADASSILPVTVMENARDYYFAGLAGALGKEAQAAVLAIDTGNTVVEFHISADLSSGQGAGSTFTRTLKQGQVYVIQALEGQDLSGTHIKVKAGNCRRIAVFSGTKCANFPKNSGCVSCDATYEQLWPVNFYNKEYFVPMVPGNTSAGVGIVALQDNTTVSVNGTIEKVLNKGEAFYKSTTAPILVTADKLINCMQYTNSNGCNGATPVSFGDPSVVEIAACTQGVTEAYFPVYRNSKYVNHVLVYAETLVKPDIALNGAWIAANAFQQFNINGRSFWVATVQVSANNTFKLESEIPFVAYNYGMADAESYASLCAASFTSMVADFEADPTTQCQKNDPVNFVGKGDSLGSVSWFFGDGGTAMGMTTSHTYFNVGTYKVKMLNSRPGSCPDTISKIIKILDGPDIALPADTTACVGSIFRIELPSDQGFTYLWENGNTSFAQTFGSDRTAIVVASDTNGCSSRDTFVAKFESCDNYELKLANVFTPNGDGQNDEWRVIFNGYTGIEVQITNRWGEVVSKYTLPEGEHWNGNVGNAFAECPEGVYYYMLVAKGRSPQDNKEVTGAIHLLR